MLVWRRFFVCLVFLTVSFQRRKPPWKADGRVESRAAPLNIWVENVPWKPSSGSGDANGKLKGKKWGEFQKCDFALQSLSVSLPNLRPWECAEVGIELSNICASGMSLS